MIRRKAFILRVEIDINEVTCPGVWLPHNGDILLKVKTLNASATTMSVPPTFPLSYQETLIFRKTITCVSNLSELQDHLNNESLKMELIQLQRHGDIPIILSQFCTKLSSLLFPSSLNKGIAIGADVNLLMEPTKKFSKGIAPKVDVSTKTIIEETTSNDPPCPRMKFINPKVISSGGKIDNDAGGDCCRCNSPSHQTCCKCQRNPETRPIVFRWRTGEMRCHCGMTHSTSSCQNCTICSCYSGYFDVRSQRSKSCCSRRNHREISESSKDGKHPTTKQRRMHSPASFGSSDNLSIKSRSSSSFEKRTPYKWLFYESLENFYRELQDKKSQKKYPQVL